MTTRQVYSPIDGDRVLWCLGFHIGRVWREDDGVSGQLLDLLADWVEQYEAYWRQIHRDEGRAYNEADYARRMVLKMLAKVDGDDAPRRKGGWIPVRDQLPEHGVDVLVHSIRGIQSVRALSADGTWDGRDGLRLARDYVSHWRPLPMAPAPEGE